MFPAFAVIHLFNWKCQSLRTPLTACFDDTLMRVERAKNLQTNTHTHTHTLARARARIPWGDWKHEKSRKRLVSVDCGGKSTAPHRPFDRHGNWISNQCFTFRFMRWSAILLEPSQEYPSGLSKLENACCMSNAENSHAFLPFSRILWTSCFLRCSEKSFLTGILHMLLKHRTTGKLVSFDFIWKRTCKCILPVGEFLCNVVLKIV
jgi:hypothetical protein